eukprot:28377-Pelagococcus_subviridis.AAC.1
MISPRPSLSSFPNRGRQRTTTWTEEARGEGDGGRVSARPGRRRGRGKSAEGRMDGWVGKTTTRRRPAREGRDGTGRDGSRTLTHSPAAAFCIFTAASAPCARALNAIAPRVRRARTRVRSRGEASSSRRGRRDRTRAVAVRVDRVLKRTERSPRRGRRPPSVACRVASRRVTTNDAPFRAAARRRREEGRSAAAAAASVGGRRSATSSAGRRSWRRSRAARARCSRRIRWSEPRPGSASRWSFDVALCSGKSSRKAAERSSSATRRAGRCAYATRGRAATRRSSSRST